MNQLLKTAGLVLIAAVFFIVDRALKIMFNGFWQSAEFIGINNFLSLKLAQNSGIAFSLPINAILIIGVTICCLLLLVYWSWLEYRQKHFLQLFSLILVIFGAYSNLLDRFRLGVVIDYIEIKGFSVFNIADIMITLGLTVLIVSLWLKKGSR